MRRTIKRGERVQALPFYLVRWHERMSDGSTRFSYAPCMVWVVAAVIAFAERFPEVVR